MKKVKKPESTPRKLVIQHEVLVQLKPLDLPQVVGGRHITQSTPFCFQ